jgi:uncharacterized protein
MYAEAEPVFFDNRNKLRLFGILHRPENGRKDVGIIILSPGIKSRVAPHRLYVKMAKKLCEMGFYVLRFDPCGIGDSAGEIEERMAVDFYASVQVGRFVNDTIDAMDWMQREHRISRFVLAGLCGGAITGLLAGAMDHRVHSLLGLGMPVILDNSTTDQSKYMARGQLEELRGTYLRKLINPKSWARFLSMKSDYRLIYKSIMTAAKSKTSVSSMSGPANGQESDGVMMKLNDSRANLNPYFPLALHTFLSTRKVILIFSGADRLYWEYEEKFMSKYRGHIAQYASNLTINIVKDANHIFSFSEWQNEMLIIATSWLKSILDPGRASNVS